MADDVDQLQQIQQPAGQSSLWPVLNALETGDFETFRNVALQTALSVVAGFVVAWVYVVARGRRREDNPTLPTTLVLLTIVIALVTVVIGGSLARAFGLVGALSIVRFRTVVEDTRDTAFVIFAVVIGMAIGSGHAVLAMLGVPAILIASLVMKHYGLPAANGGGPMLLSVKLALGLDPDGTLVAVFERHLSEYKFTGTETAKQGTALEVSYQVRLKPGEKPFALVADLNKTEGVLGVDLKG
jgi:hypothetical protein